MNTKSFATLGSRVLGYMVDGLLFALLVQGLPRLLGFSLPDSIAGYLLGGWLLFRDAGGWSPGKWILGLSIEGSGTGDPHFGPGYCNLPLAIGMSYPLAVGGFLLGLTRLIGAVDIRVLFFGADHQRLGDWIAGTRVVGTTPKAETVLDLGGKTPAGDA